MANIYVIFTFSPVFFIEKCVLFQKVCVLLRTFSMERSFVEHFAAYIILLMCM